MATLEWVKAQGFSAHAHAYDHSIEVVAGVVKVQTGGFTRTLKPGDSIIHKAGVNLKAWAASDRATIRVDHAAARSQIQQ